jgi:hypothetical protein
VPTATLGSILIRVCASRQDPNNRLSDFSKQMHSKPRDRFPETEKRTCSIGSKTNKNKLTPSWDRHLLGIDTCIESPDIDSWQHVVPAS